MEVHGPVGELSEADAAVDHVAEHVGEDEDGVEDRGRAGDGGAVVVPEVLVFWMCEVAVKFFSSPFEKFAVNSGWFHYIGFAVNLERYTVEVNVAVVLTFRAVFCTRDGEDDFVCFCVVVVADVEIDVSAGPAGGVRIVLGNALPFEEDVWDVVFVQGFDDFVQGTVESGVAFFDGQFFHDESLCYLHRWALICR